MASIHPFRALRYTPAAGDLSRLLAPPYDVITTDQQEALYAASPHNVVRLILGAQRPTDTERDNRYTRARDDFLAWRRQGLLTQDAAAAFYAVRQTFLDPFGDRRTRLGVIALLDLEDVDEDQMLKHERTLAGPKADRARLLEAVPANLEPIFLIYPDTAGSLQRAVEAACAGTPTVTATVGADDVRLWVLRDAAFAKRFEQHLKTVPLLIADGHHRFEVAIAHRDRVRHLMAYVVSMADPGLVVHPIHRLLDRAPATAGLASLCDVEPAANASAALAWVQRQEAGQGCFGYCERGAAYRVRVREAVRRRWVAEAREPAELAGLDVSVLHGLILPATDIVSEQVRYTGNPAEVWAALQNGQAKAAWLLREIPLAVIFKLAQAGYVMPPKSTYFYPKVPSGLTIHPFD
jgi:uncharacterized protein (DUF1015 family)